MNIDKIAERIIKAFSKGQEMPYTEARIKNLVSLGVGFSILTTGGGYSDNEEVSFSSPSIEKHVKDGRKDWIISESARAAKYSKFSPKQKIVIKIL